MRMISSLLNIYAELIEYKQVFFEIKYNFVTGQKNISR